MSNIDELIASNDPMATPVMGIDGSPADIMMPVPTHVPTSPQQQQHHVNDGYMTMGTNRMTHATRTGHSDKLGALYTEHRESTIVAACAAIVLLPFVQDLLKKHVPMYEKHHIVRIATTAALIGLAHLILKDYMKVAF